MKSGRLFPAFSENHLHAGARGVPVRGTLMLREHEARHEAMLAKEYATDLHLRLWHISPDPVARVACLHPRLDILDKGGSNALSFSPHADAEPLDEISLILSGV